MNEIKIWIAAHPQQPENYMVSRHEPMEKQVKIHTGHFGDNAEWVNWRECIAVPVDELKLMK